MYNVLQNKSKMQYKFDKFPYVIIDDALPTDLYNKLSADFPNYKKIMGNNEYKENFAYRYNAYNSLNDQEISKEWKEFIKFHTSYDFLEEFYLVFGEDIKKYIKLKKKNYLIKITLELDLKRKVILILIVNL